MLTTPSKILSSHLQRNAYIYIRQSMLQQVLRNRESTERQYALAQRACELGWSKEQVLVVDDDLGCSGKSAHQRIGFQRLVSEVGLGRAGVVIGIEVSRLARCCSDSHRLIESCVIGDSLIIDEDGIYDPANFNDRLLLGLKGTMSEAELHFLRNRLWGGKPKKVNWPSASRSVSSTTAAMKSFLTQPANSAYSLRPLSEVRGDGERLEGGRFFPHPSSALPEPKTRRLHGQ